MKFISVLLFSLLTINIASAGWHVEPYLGYMLIGDADDETTTAGTEYDLDYHPLLLGGRFGYNFMGFVSGIDFSLSPDFTLGKNTKSSASETEVEYAYSAKYIGLFAGYNFPALFRIWLTYFVKAQLKGQDLAVLDNEYSGNGFGVGFGYTGLPVPYMSLNAEIRKPTFDESFVKSTGTTQGVDYSAFEFFISVSAAFDIN